MRKSTRVRILLLVGLVFAVGVLLLVADGAIRQQGEIAEPPPTIRWCPVSGGFTPEAHIAMLNLEWLNE